MCEERNTGSCCQVYLLEISSPLNLVRTAWRLKKENAHTKTNTIFQGEKRSVPNTVGLMLSTADRKKNYSTSCFNAGICLGQGLTWHKIQFKKKIW